MIQSAAVTPPSTGQQSEQHKTLQEALQGFLADLDGTYGVAAYSFSTGERVAINDSKLFPSASLYELIALYEAYSQVESGKIDLATLLEIRPQHLAEADENDLSAGDRISFADALHLVITVSSNAAAYAVLDEIGWQNFNRAAAELGLKDTNMPLGAESELLPGWRRETVSTSPCDMLRFFDLLARRQLVSASASDAMLAILLEQQANDRIPAGLPDGVLAAHKTGELYGVRNDAGIVFTETNAYVLVVLSKGANVDEAVAAITEIARLVHARFG